MIRKFKRIIIFAFLTLFLTGCAKTSNFNNTQIEQPRLYSKNIECEVENCDYKHWYASAHHYQCNITIYSKEYDLRKTFSLNGDDAKRCENIKTGDTINCQLYTYQLDSTEEIVNRYINKINN